MSTEILIPINQPSLLYPALYGVKPRRKDYRCKRCGSDNQTCLRAETKYFKGGKLEDVFFDFECGCGNAFFVAAKLLVNEVLEEQMERIFNFTKVTGKEFGALVIRTVDGDIILDMIKIGEDREIEIVPTHELRNGEEILGSFHCHPATDWPSLFDCATFLRDDWEKISMVAGVNGNFNVMLKTEETKKITDLKSWLEENKDLEGEKTLELGDKYKFLFYRGKADKLSLKSEDQGQSSSLEEIFKKVRGIKELGEKVKKGKKED